MVANITHLKRPVSEGMRIGCYFLRALIFRNSISRHMFHVTSLESIIGALRGSGLS